MYITNKYEPTHFSAQHLDMKSQQISTLFPCFVFHRFLAAMSQDDPRHRPNHPQWVKRRQWKVVRNKVPSYAHMRVTWVQWWLVDLNHQGLSKLWVWGFLLGDEILPSCGDDFFINHELKIPMKQPRWPKWKVRDRPRFFCCGTHLFSTYLNSLQATGFFGRFGTCISYPTKREPAGTASTQVGAGWGICDCSQEGISEGHNLKQHFHEFQ